MRMSGWRNPYVGSGADGARRSAGIDRDELDGLDQDDPRREALEESIERWEQQAEEEDAEARRPGSPSTGPPASKFWVSHLESPGTTNEPTGC